MCPPALTFEDGAAIWEVEAIIAHRMTKNGKSQGVSSCSWVGWPPEHDQWEPVSKFKGAPDLVSAYNGKHGLCVIFSSNICQSIIIDTIVNNVQVTGLVL